MKRAPRKKPPCTLKEFRRRYNYDPKTGHFTYAYSRSRWKKGARAGGGSHTLGYRRLGVLQVFYYEHVLAWWTHYGEWPTKEVDHINNDRADNRIKNLQLLTHADNQTRITGNGFRYEDGAYRSQIMNNGKWINLGRHKTEKEARAAYLKAKQELLTERKIS